MKIKRLAVLLISLSLIGAALADDLPQMGYSVRTPLKDLAEKGYRWVTVNGPFACATEQQVRQVTSDLSESAELHMVEDSGAYYLIPGKLVRVIKDDRANGMSEILLGGVTRPLWTYTRFLSASPILGFNGIVETPETSGLIATGDVQ